MRRLWDSLPNRAENRVCPKYTFVEFSWEAIHGLIWAASITAKNDRYWPRWTLMVPSSCPWARNQSLALGPVLPLRDHTAMGKSLHFPGSTFTFWSSVLFTLCLCGWTSGIPQMPSQTSADGKRPTNSIWQCTPSMLQNKTYCYQALQTCQHDIWYTKDGFFVFWVRVSTDHVGQWAISKSRWLWLIAKRF